MVTANPRYMHCSLDSGALVQFRDAQFGGCMHGWQLQTRPVARIACTPLFRTMAVPLKTEVNPCIRHLPGVAGAATPALLAGCLELCQAS